MSVLSSVLLETLIGFHSRVESSSRLICDAENVFEMDKPMSEVV